MNTAIYQPLRRNVSLLGRLLGEVITEAEGAETFNAVEKIRKLSKAARAQEQADYQPLQTELAQLKESELLPVARAFSQFLNLANLAEQRHAISRLMDEQFSATQELESVFERMQNTGVSGEQLIAAVDELQIDLVLTAHPTEIVRRTLIHKHDEIDRCLERLELRGRTEREEAAIILRLRELIAQIWHSQDFRSERPTPIDEAKWGFAVVEKSLWQAVPNFLRRLSASLSKASGEPLPLLAAPVRFSSWMGGDRDGNPNVTAEISQEVLLLSRWQATDLYLRDVSELIDELSMNDCTQSFAELAGQSNEPYRAVLRSLRRRLQATLLFLERKLAGEDAFDANVISSSDALLQPLFACYESLRSCKMANIANSKLLDTIRRVQCFGVHLVRLDIRQESSVHTQLLSELSQFLEIGDYEQWSEQQRLDFLYAELGNKRPLIPTGWQASAASCELLDTCRLVAQHPEEAFGAYVISMASNASDVLAVQLLLKESGCQHSIPVVPLFETLADLQSAADVVRSLLNNASYRAQIDGKLMIMIGYSDSAKDAGVMAAAWAQYTAQEKLLAVCKEFDVDLTLFHGRGGTIGRGGAPARSALLSQPPGSLHNGLRVTEQGEMIRTKLGLSSIATKTLALYTSAILEANLCEPPQPAEQWRRTMDQLSVCSTQYYRQWVQNNSDFVSYFRQATPEIELGKLPIGSRPSRRRADNSISSLRAIPWIFAWSQNRLMLPAWLGAAQALEECLQHSGDSELQRMRDAWPFFATRLSMLEMVFAKSDAKLSAHYDSRLVDESLRNIGQSLRSQLKNDIATLLQLIESTSLLEDQPWALTTIGLRNVYTDPLNLLQVELLNRYRQASDATLEQGIMVTIAGIAAGMRNTG